MSTGITICFKMQINLKKHHFQNRKDSHDHYSFNSFFGEKLKFFLNSFGHIYTEGKMFYKLYKFPS